ncbi:unnamed protein product [Rotaria sordida]|uniref:Uncharacterized protein n=2 Tax=Rotaria sordida TaxID=392033 RepID=A0A815GK09_9BILA|nr:unnamed protein product [Rotaria sordida]
MENFIFSYQTYHPYSSHKKSYNYLSRHYKQEKKNMIFSNINCPTLLLSYLLIIIVLPTINSSRFRSQNSLPLQLKSSEYKQLAKYCYIDDYSAWLQQRREFMIWFELATILRLPIQENKQFQHEYNLYRLQHECLRVVERLPVSFGPG